MVVDVAIYVSGDCDLDLKVFLYLKEVMTRYVESDVIYRFIYRGGTTALK